MHLHLPFAAVELLLALVGMAALYHHQQLVGGQLPAAVLGAWACSLLPAVLVGQHELSLRPRYQERYGGDGRDGGRLRGEGRGEGKGGGGCSAAAAPDLGGAGSGIVPLVWGKLGCQWGTHGSAALAAGSSGSSSGAPAALLQAAGVVNCKAVPVVASSGCRPGRRVVGPYRSCVATTQLTVKV